MPKITQAELDAMLASGEVTLAPPKEAKATPDTDESNKTGIFPLTTENNEVPATEKKEPSEEKNMFDVTFSRPKPEYPALEPKPMGRPLDKEEKKYLLETRRELKNIRNPTYRNLASEATKSGMRISDIDGLVAYFHDLDKWENEKYEFEENLKKEERDHKRKIRGEIKQEQTRDRRKTAEKYSQGAAAYKTMSKILDRMTDNYDDSYVGPWENIYNDKAEKSLFLPKDDGYAVYRQDWENVFSLGKEANNYGSAFTAGEMERLRGTMPTLDDKNESYKRKLTNYQRTLRDILASKLESSKKAGYNIGDLEDAVKTINTAYEKSLDRFGLRGDPQFADSEGNDAKGAKDDGWENPDEILGASEPKTPAPKAPKRINGNNLDELDAILWR
jgi:hypothetical protein